MTFGWHAYFFYQKHKFDKLFRHHFVRGALYSIWQEFKKYLGEQRPYWLVPKEIIKTYTDFKMEERLTYKDLTYWKENKIKLKEEKEISVNLGWWRYVQIKSLFNLDKRMFGF